MIIFTIFGKFFIFFYSFILFLDEFGRELEQLLFRFGRNLAEPGDGVLARLPSEIAPQRGGHGMDQRMVLLLVGNDQLKEELNQRIWMRLDNLLVASNEFELLSFVPLELICQQLDG